MREEKYALAVGEDTRVRLGMLNQLYNPLSTSFLQELVKPGMRILELACGFGIMSRWLAEQVGPQGEVIAIDISPEQLAIAKQPPCHTHLKFLEMSVYDLETLPGQFDLIYSRFIFCHITEPDQVIAQAKQKLTPQGMLVCDDVVISSIRACPQQAFMLDYSQCHLELYTRQNKDPNIGEKLPTKFKHHHFDEITARLSCPILTSPAEKKFLFNTNQELKAAFLATQSLNEEQFSAFQHGLSQLEHDEDAILVAAAMMQCAGRNNNPSCK